MMQSNGGLLGAFMASPQASVSAPAGGLLAGLGTQNSGLQMAQQLSQNPTPETAQRIIAQLHQMQSPQAAQLEQMVSQFMHDPQALKQFADAVAQKIGGGNA